MINPIFTYGNAIWASNYPTRLACLTLLQKQGMFYRAVMHKIVKMCSDERKCAVMKGRFCSDEYRVRVKKAKNTRVVSVFNAEDKRGSEFFGDEVKMSRELIR